MDALRRARDPDEASAVPLVIGLGNEHRGDDAFGIAVARRLRRRLAGIGTVLERDSEGTELLELWTGYDRVWVVDAVRAGGSPGTVYRIEVGAEALPTPLAVASSHGVSLGQAVALGQVLHRLPRHLVVHGVEPATFAIGGDLSAPVADALEPVARRIEEEVRESGGPSATAPGQGRADA